MRKLFRGYYTPTEEEFAQLWKDCIFSFDTNILLNIYRYSPEARGRFFEILNKLEERIWITHQAASEYHRNRIDVISNQLRPYDEIQVSLDKSLKELQKLIEQYSKRHSFSTFIDSKQIVGVIDRAHKRVKKTLRDASLKYPDLVNQDEVHERLTDLFDGKVGSSYAEEELLKIHKKADERFKKNLPPGYLDSRGDKKKQPPDSYGDVVIWFQLINYAKAESKPVIFVTDETGEDWWLKHQGKTISPRPELRQEMFSESGTEFYLYTGDRFLDRASDFLQLTNKPEVIEEARNVRSQEQEREELVAINSSLATELKNSYKSIPEIEQIRLSALRSSSAISELLRNLPGLNASSTLSEHLRGLPDVLSASSPLSEHFRSVLGGLKASSVLPKQLRGLPETTYLTSPSKQIEQDEEDRLAEEANPGE